MAGSRAVVVLLIALPWAAAGLVARVDDDAIDLQQRSIALRTLRPAAAVGKVAAATATVEVDSSDTDGPNPLLITNGFPRWDEIRAHHIAPAAHQVLAEESAALDLLEQDLATGAGPLTFERLFVPYTQIRLRVDSLLGQAYHLSSVASTPELRAALDDIAPDVVSFDLRMGQSAAIYEAASRLRASAWDALDGEQQRVLDILLRDMSASGVGLAGEQRATFNAIKLRMDELQSSFSKNVMESTRSFKLLVRASDRAQLAGLGSTTLAVLAQNAQLAGYPDATAESGPWLLKLGSAATSAVVSYAHDRSLRQQVYMAQATVAASGANDNNPVIEELLTLRHQLAQLLGFPNWARYRATSKMATYDEATARMQELLRAAQPAAAQEVAMLTSFARNATGNASLQLEWWDVSYWAQRVQEARFQVADEEVRAHLPLDNVLAGLTSLLERLYGVTMKPAQPKPPTWHPDVLVFSLSNVGSSKPIAYIYADLFARPGSKSGGAHAGTLVDGASYWLGPSPAAAAAAARGSSNSTEELRTAQLSWLKSAPRQAPVAHVVCNSNPPTEGQPALLGLNDASTLFHEFGHALQMTLTTTRQGLNAGTRNIEWDAVEIPSMMQEKFVFDPVTLASMARHWATGTPLPKATLDRISDLQKFMRALHGALTQSLADLELHGEYVSGGVRTAADVFRNAFATNMPFLPANHPGDRPLTSFGHIFTSSYDAGYYSYQFADIHSADIYERFHALAAAPGREAASRAAVAELGRAYRNTVLSLGGGTPPAAVFERLMGRPPNVGALLRYNGVDAYIA